MKNGDILAYFPSNPQDKFYEGDKFKKSTFVSTKISERCSVEGEN